MTRVCAIFPLLPDPAAFVERVRTAYPGAEVTLFTGNAEAARRAAELDVAQVVFHPWDEFTLAVPEPLRRQSFDRVVIHLERAKRRFYTLFVVQTLRWRGLKFDFDIDGHRLPARDAVGFMAATLLRFQVPAVVMAVVLHGFWLLLLPFCAAVGMLRGRTARDLATVWRHTTRMLGTGRAYIVVNPRYPLRALRCAWRALADFARGPVDRPPGETRRLLLIRLDHLGDLIATTGTLAALKAQDPPWHITLVVGPWSRAVVEHDDSIDELLVYPTSDPTFCRGALPPDAAAQRRQVRRRLAETPFDAVIEPSTGGEATSLLYFPRAARRATMHLGRWYAHGLAAVIDSAQQPEPRRLARIFAAAGVEVSPQTTRLNLAPAAHDEARRVLAENELLDRPFLAVHLGAGWPGRRWPVERFAEIARRAHETYGLAPVGLAGPGEEAEATQFTAALADLGALVLVKPKLPTIFAIIGHAAAFAGNDSAFMHAAGAQQVPTLGVFGPTDMKRFFPSGSTVRAASLHLGCSPCPQSFCTDPRCIQELDVDRVWETFVALMDGGGKEASGG